CIIPAPRPTCFAAASALSSRVSGRFERQALLASPQRHQQVASGGAAALDRALLEVFGRGAYDLVH
ncbi:MAG TPA: hypothetical protein VIW29_21050, partial [Polyangiaceae bacterium]